MSNVKVQENAKVALGDRIIEAALDKESFEKLMADPKGELNKIPGVEVPEGVTIEVLQNNEKTEFLVVPNREMVVEQLASLGTYTLPPTYTKPPADNLDKYKYRVGDYVLAQCG